MGTGQAEVTVMAELLVGSPVVDRDGFPGVIVGVTYHGDSVWYDVRFSGGVAVRYPLDLWPI
jgi:hypothetical protein